LPSDLTPAAACPSPPGGEGLWTLESLVDVNELGPLADEDADRCLGAASDDEGCGL